MEWVTDRKPEKSGKYLVARYFPDTGKVGYEMATWQKMYVSTANHWQGRNGRLGKVAAWMEVPLYEETNDYKKRRTAGKREANRLRKAAQKRKAGAVVPNDSEFLDGLSQAVKRYWDLP